ncbi:hypothetical protein [Clostridium saudiense]|uniref:hypothetical protein n=1 Tax=Clostridium saudiense TaxID=1414720 RepID=UPI002670E9A2|nr:hypothetical protein [Clostridium saudiense]
MNNNLEKLCRFLVTNSIANKDLVVGFDENLVIYKDYEWDLERDEVEISDFRPFDCAKLKITDVDEYKLTIFEDGTIEVETPEEKTELEELRRENSELLYKIEMLEKANKDLANIIKNKSETDMAEKDDVIKRFLKSYGAGDLDEVIEHFKSMKEYADLCNKVYLNTMLTEVR